MRIAAIYRNGKSIAPDGSALIQEDDEVFFIAARKDIRVVMSEMRKLEDPVRHVVIAGGGSIGFRLATALEQTNRVKVIERSKDRARVISERLSKAIVLHGDAADEELLLEENIDTADIFVALTNAEEANILSAMVGQTAGLQESNGADKQALICRNGRKWCDRRRYLSTANYHWIPARTCTAAVMS